MRPRSIYFPFCFLCGGPNYVNNAYGRCWFERRIAERKTVLLPEARKERETDA